ncbi:hypothetical protein FACS1894217_11210 [Clostridia bacterium]|nr:hypothetical protein FACS1894217_11210 [Clostridia bacterium]
MRCEEELSKQYTFSERHNQRMKKLFAQEERRERIHKALTWTRQAAAVIVLVAAVLFGALMTVPSVRAAVVEATILWFERFTTFLPFSSEAPENGNLTPTYLPNGYTLNEILSAGDMTVVRYLDAAGNEINLTTMPSDGSLSVNNEDVECSTIVSGDVTYNVFAAVSSGKGNTIVWDSGGVRFELDGTIDVDELLKMAASVVT